MTYEQRNTFTTEGASEGLLRRMLSAVVETNYFLLTVGYKQLPFLHVLFSHVFKFKFNLYFICIFVSVCNYEWLAIDFVVFLLLFSFAESWRVAGSCQLQCVWLKTMKMGSCVWEKRPKSFWMRSMSRWWWCLWWDSTVRGNLTLWTAWQDNSPVRENAESLLMCSACWYNNEVTITECSQTKN